MLTSTSDISVLWVTRSSLCRGTRSIEHTHENFFQFCYNQRGQTRSADGSCSRPGEVFCAPPQTRHGGQEIIDPLGTIDIKFIVRDPMLYTKLCRFSFRDLTLDPFSVRFLDSLMEDIIRSHLSQETVDSAFSFFLRRLIDLNPELLKITVSAQETACESIARYINENYTGEITLADIAEHVGLSRNYTSSVFSSTFGITVIEYLNLVRVRAACLMIAYSDTPIGDVCQRCGFGDRHNFGRTFRNIIGVSPVNYRQAHSTSDLLFDDGLDMLKRVPLDEASKTIRPFTYVVAPGKLILWKDYYSFLSQKFEVQPEV